jgi:hypothetical protein
LLRDESTERESATFHRYAVGQRLVAMPRGEDTFLFQTVGWSWQEDHRVKRAMIASLQFPGEEAKTVLGCT